MIELLIGVIIGLVAGVFVGAGVAKPNITNEIGKIKGNNAPVTTSQEMGESIAKPKKLGIFARIFSRKKLNP